MGVQQRVRSKQQELGELSNLNTNNPVYSWTKDLKRLLTGRLAGVQTSRPRGWGGQEAASCNHLALAKQLFSRASWCLSKRTEDVLYTKTRTNAHSTVYSSLSLDMACCLLEAERTLTVIPLDCGIACGARGNELSDRRSPEELICVLLSEILQPGGSAL